MVPSRNRLTKKFTTFSHLLLVALVCIFLNLTVSNPVEPPVVVRRPEYRSVKIDSKRGVLKDLGRLGIQTASGERTVIELSQTTLGKQPKASNRSIETICKEEVPVEFRVFTYSDNTLPNSNCHTIRKYQTKSASPKDQDLDSEILYGPERTSLMIPNPPALTEALKYVRNISEAISQYSQTHQDYLNITEEEFGLFNSLMELKETREAKSRYLSVSLRKEEVLAILEQNIHRYFDRSLPPSALDHLHRRILNCEQSAVFQQFATPPGLFYSKKFISKEFKVLVAACNPNSAEVELLMHHSYKYAYFKNPTLSDRLKEKTKNILERWLAGTIVTRFAYPSKPTTREEDLEDFDSLSPLDTVKEMEDEVDPQLGELLDFYD